MKQQLLTVLKKYQQMKWLGAADEQQQAFLISALDEGKWLATRSGFLTPRKVPKQSLVKPMVRYHICSSFLPGVGRLPTALGASEISDTKAENSVYAQMWSK
jgi:hypothetical protein